MLVVHAITLVWIACDTTPGAQEAVMNACAHTEQLGSYDVSGFGNSQEGSFEYDAKVSEEDFHVTLTLTFMEDGEITQGPVDTEIIQVDGLGYERTEGGEWIPLHRPTYFPFIFQKGTLCLDAKDSNFASDGKERLRDIPTQRYIASRVVPIHDRTTQTQDVVTRYWVDDFGLVRQLEHTITVENVWRSVLIAVISGYGEPNIITAPTLP